MAKIEDKPFAQAVSDMSLPVDNNGVDNHTTIQSLDEDYLINTRNYIRGDGQGGVITNPSGTGIVTIPQWRNIWPLTSAAGAVTPDLQRSATFSLTLTEDTEVQLPDNITQTGITFRIYVTQDGTGGWNLTFSAAGQRYRLMDNSGVQTYTAGSRFMVEVFLYSGTIHPYRITRFAAGAATTGVTDLIPAKITVTSAQLLANQSNTLIPAPGANRFIEIVGGVWIVNGSGSNAYSIPSGAYIMSGDLKTRFAEVMLDFFPDDKYFSNYAVQTPQVGNICQDNQALILYASSGAATGGDYDVTFYFSYRIIDIT